MALIVVDASLSPRIGTELRRRGRPAKSLAELGLQRLKDDPMLEALAHRLSEPYVLLTGDDAMPATHRPMIDATGTTVATIDARWQRSGFEQEAFKFEVSQRWAHKIASQVPLTIVRYSAGTYRPWTLPRGR